jgi:hypothetical protein
MDKVGIRHEISAVRERRVQIRPAIPVAGQHIYRRMRVRERGHCHSVFVLPSVMNDIAGMNDDIGGRIECVDVRNRECEIAYSPISVGGIKRNMGIGDLRDDHDAEPLEINFNEANQLENPQTSC